MVFLHFNIFLHIQVSFHFSIFFLKEIYNFTISGEFSFTNAFDPDSHGVCHGDELIYLFEPFYTHNGDPGLGPLSGDDLGKKLMLFSSSQTFKTLIF